MPHSLMARTRSSSMRLTGKDYMLIERVHGFKYRLSPAKLHFFHVRLAAVPVLENDEVPSLNLFPGFRFMKSKRAVSENFRSESPLTLTQYND